MTLSSAPCLAFSYAPSHLYGDRFSVTI